MHMFTSRLRLTLSYAMRNWRMRGFVTAISGNFLLTLSTTAALMLTKSFDLLTFVGFATVASVTIGVGLNSNNPKYSYNVLLFGIGGIVLAAQVAIAAIAFANITMIVYMALANVSCYLMANGAYRMAQITPFSVEKQVVPDVLTR